MGHGRKSKPKQQLKLAGTDRDDRCNDCIEPTAGMAACPVWLSDAAKERWPEVATMLSDMGLMSPDYVVGIAMLCDAIADWIEATAACSEMPKVYETSNGNRVQDPLVGIKNKAFERVLKVAREFGLTPSAMRGVSSPATPASDPLDSFAKSKNG